MRIRNTRRGFTLLEILLVMAVLLILAAVTIPSLSSLYGNVRQRAAADVVRARLADARALAMETGTAYRVAISADNTKIRVGPDGADFGDLPASAQATGTAKVIESTLEKATVERGIEPDEPPAVVDASGWMTVVTFLHDGTCKEDTVMVRILEGDFPPLRIQIRGVTGGTRTLPQVAGGAK